jgi:hypothetical protein
MNKQNKGATCFLCDRWKTVTKHECTTTHYNCECGEEWYVCPLHNKRVTKLTYHPDLNYDRTECLCYEATGIRDNEFDFKVKKLLYSPLALLTSPSKDNFDLFFLLVSVSLLFLNSFLMILLYVNGGQYYF